MDFTLLLLAGFYGLVLLVVTVILIQRLGTRHSKTKRTSKWGYFPVAAALAFQQLNGIVRPHERHVIQAMYDETTDEDDEGAPNDPTAHLHRQAEKIRRGKSLDRLTAMVNLDVSTKP